MYIEKPEPERDVLVCACVTVTVANDAQATAMTDRRWRVYFT